MKKKYFIIFIILAIILTIFVGCTSNKEDTDDKDNSADNNNSINSSSPYFENEEYRYSFYHDENYNAIGVILVTYFGNESEIIIPDSIDGLNF